MLSVADYKLHREGDWSFWSIDDFCDSAMRRSLLAVVERQPSAKHPQTLAFSWPTESAAPTHFLKVFHRRGGADIVKDLLRISKARRFWQQGLELGAAGFDVPRTVVMAEQRRAGMVRRSLVVTEALSGLPLPLYLSGLDAVAHGRTRAKMKRNAIAQLAELVRRFHALGFVHGDLIASNLFVVDRPPDRWGFFFMDNDRTRRYSPWLTVQLRKRNLVQLNRLPLAHISLQDRMRFLHAYLGVSKLAERDRQLARWLEARTRKRRKECDGADPKQDFRRLMRWVPSATEAKPT